MNKFLVDVSSGRKLYQALLENNYDVEFIDNILPRASDLDVLNYAEKENKILITNDKDFGELVFRLKMPSSGVILLRLRKNIPINRIKYTLYILRNFSDELKSNFVVVTEGKIRVRKL